MEDSEMRIFTLCLCFLSACGDSTIYIDSQTTINHYPARDRSVRMLVCSDTNEVRDYLSDFRRSERCSYDHVSHWRNTGDITYFDRQGQSCRVEAVELHNSRRGGYTVTPRIGVLSVYCWNSALRRV